MQSATTASERYGYLRRTVAPGVLVVDIPITWVPSDHLFARHLLHQLATAAAICADIRTGHAEKGAAMTG